MTAFLADNVAEEAALLASAEDVALRVTDRVAKLMESTDEQALFTGAAL